MPNTPDKRQIFLRFLPFAAVSTAIFWLSLTSSPPEIDAPLFGWDKAQHALAYGTLTWFSGKFFVLGRQTVKRAWGLAILYAITFGGALELLQAIAGTGRTCEWGDLLADTLGTLAIGAIGLWLEQKNT